MFSVCGCSAASASSVEQSQKYVNIKLEEDELVIDGSSFKGKVPKNYLLDVIKHIAGFDQIADDINN